jgi:rhodanese-related sulfurtransferase
MSAVDRRLAEARQRLDRVDAAQAKVIHENGGLLVDIRPAAQRAEYGEIPGAVIIERNNLEWRLDPDGSHRLPGTEDPARPVIVFCQEGYASSFAAVSLLDIGRTNVTDLDGGYLAWMEAGHNTVLPSRIR